MIQPLEIVTLESPNASVLYKVASPIERITPEIQILARQMVLAMIKNKGCGLAANQVGALVRLIVVTTNGGIITVANPEIFPYGELDTIREACLSNPGFGVEITRQKGVRVKYTDMLGRQQEKAFNGFVARIIQHEVDHLNGINIHQKINPTETNNL